VTAVGERWTRWWFAPAAPVNLAVCRIVFFAAMLMYYLPRDVSAWANVSSVFWDPIWIFDGRLRLPLLSAGHPVLSARTLDVIQVAWKIALALSCVGFLTRVSTAVSFVLGLYVIGLPTNFGHASHQFPILVFVMGILALSRCGDAWSVDAWLRRSHPDTGGAGRTAVSGEYTWPLRMVWVVMSLAFFAAGVSKLRHGGLAWITSDTLALNLIVNNYFSNTTEDPLTTWVLYVAQHRGLCHLLAAMTMILELGFPIALVSRTARRIAVPGAIAMLLGIRVLLGPAFELFALCYVFWVPWDRVAAAALATGTIAVSPRDVLFPAGRLREKPTPSARARS